MAIPTLLFLSLVIFLLLDLAPGDPLADLPLTIPPEVRERIRASLGLGEPVLTRYLKWLGHFFVTEPLYLADHLFGTDWAGGRQRLLSFQSRGPVMQIIAERMPQTLWIVGFGYLLGVLVALPLGILSAWRPHGWNDRIGTFASMVGYSVPTFFTGVLLIVVFSVKLGWFPSIYDTTLRVTDWESLLAQIRQMVLPVTVVALFNASQISRFTRAAMLDNLHQDYVRTARAKGMSERVVLLVHVLRNSLIPVVTVIALGLPTMFGGAIITEQVFKVNGLGQQLIQSIEASDIPMVQTLTFIFAVLIVLSNLLADVLYALLDPRIRHA